MYSLPNYKVLGELKSYQSFQMYPPLWTSMLVAMHDEIENASIEYGRGSYDASYMLLTAFEFHTYYPKLSLDQKLSKSSGFLHSLPIHSLSNKNMNTISKVFSPAAVVLDR